jgi:perosamine synthetase
MLFRFCQYIRPISISLSPNTEKDDILLAFKLLFQPWQWERGKAIHELEEGFKKYLGIKHAISFNSGRSAFMAILNSLNLEKGSEVLLQAFTCNAVPNPVIWSGLKPVYVDCDEKTFNIDIEDLKRTLRQAQGKKPKVLVVQHTFGLPAEMDEILKICQEGDEDKFSSSRFANARVNNLILIEDCAHSLGAEYKGKKVGTFGKVSFFSFSRDKVISSVYGGMVITNDDNLAQKIKDYQEKIGFPSCCWIKQQLLHPLFMNWLILPTYRIFGKYFLILFQWFRILSKAVHWKEKRGLRPGYFPKRMSNALAMLALNQFQKLERFNNHRKEIANFYLQELSNTKYLIPDTEHFTGNIFLRFSVKHEKAHEIIKEAWAKNLLIGDWYTSPIAPPDTKLDKMEYIPGSCPNAERLAKITLNLPTHINISQKEAQKIVNFLKNMEK